MRNADNNVGKDEIMVALSAVKALADAIRELGEVPAGRVYAPVMGVMTHGDFERAVGLLVRAGLVRRECSDLLVWIGPAAEPGQCAPCVG